MRMDKSGMEMWLLVIMIITLLLLLLVLVFYGELGQALENLFSKAGEWL